MMRPRYRNDTVRIMVRRNIVRRSLIGVGGVRLFDVPGLVYPPEMLVEQPAPQDDMLTEVPPWAISIEHAAAILHCCPSSARILLNKADVEKCKVKLPKMNPAYYWRKSQVEAVAAARPKELSAVPDAYMSATDAARYLNVARSTLNRYLQHGVLASLLVRFRTPAGSLCLKQFFLRDDVEKLHNYRIALRHRQCHVPINEYLRLKHASQGGASEQAKPNLRA